MDLTKGNKIFLNYKDNETLLKVFLLTLTSNHVCVF